jgi:hypothetical protein
MCVNFAAALHENATFLEFFLCLSRACLGKIMHFIYIWRKKCRFLMHCTLHIVHMQASASCARRAMEVLVVLVGIATEIGRPVEQVRRLEARGLRR